MFVISTFPGPVVERLDWQVRLRVPRPRAVGVPGDVGERHQKHQKHQKHIKPFQL